MNMRLILVLTFLVLGFNINNITERAHEKLF